MVREPIGGSAVHTAFTCTGNYSSVVYNSTVALRNVERYLNPKILMALKKVRLEVRLECPARKLHHIIQITKIFEQRQRVGRHNRRHLGTPAYFCKQQSKWTLTTVVLIVAQKARIRVDRGRR